MVASTGVPVADRTEEHHDMSNTPIPARLVGRVAYVLGGGAQGVPRAGELQPMGNGRAIALRLAAEGATVAVSDIAREAADVTVASIRATGGDGLALQTDARDPEACRQAVSAVIEAYGRLDIVVCNVGIHGGLTVRRQTVQDWDRAFETNVRSHFFTAQAALEPMLKAGSGTLIFVTSTAADRSSGTSAAYESSKAAQIAVMRSFAVRYGDRGIRSNALMLGPIDSGMVRGLFGTDDAAEAWRDAIAPAGRQGRPEEVAAASAFLASDDASYVNGTTLVVDGGLTATSAGFKR